MLEKLNQISEVIWEIPAEGDMKVPSRIYSSKEMLNLISKDKSLFQLRNVASLPGIQKYSLVMPDVHEGYGFPIGGIAATDLDTGVISPGGIGYDINCGIRLLKSKLSVQDFKKNVNHISKEIYEHIPAGVGKGGKIKLPENEINNVLENGCKWAVKEGYASKEDIEHIESKGSLNNADSSTVSSQAKKRSFDQIGTMGAGNHFIEINFVQHIFDEDIARVFGLFEGQIVLQLHTGSRGLGHQVASDYIKLMVNKANHYDFKLPDRELSCVLINSEDGQNYFSAMSAAANFAWVNRQIITWELRQVWKNVFGSSAGQLELLYDVAHNIAKIEEHNINGQLKEVMVHRKGATRAFPANHKEVPKAYRRVGQPVLIPGSMGTASYVLVGKQGSMEQTFGSCCHGSGRILSRTAAKMRISGEDLKSNLNLQGIIVQTASLPGLAEEAPAAYKDVEMVVDVVELAGIAGKVARLKPLAVIKG